MRGLSIPSGLSRALTFVARPGHERYIGALDVQQVAALIRTGEGSLGNTRSYFDLTVQTLAGLRIRDRGIDRLHRAVLEADGALRRADS